ncbi:MAG TPA: pseudouridine synthase, partial [Terriglobales bacterium]|nr:pseudouridine synthase [Terriglobales bacterium]
MAPVPPSQRVGLARALSKLGYCSRARGFALVRSGRVRLKGSVTRNPESPVRLGRDRIEVDGSPVRRGEIVYLMMNKPRGIVTTTRDEKGRATGYSLLPAGLPWVAPVGRLDKASEGLLLFTNDPAWAAKTLAPETHLDKTYHVQISSIAGPALVTDITQGLRTADGDTLRAKRAGILRRGTRNSWLEIVLDEGRNRHIRRMLDGLGIEVLRLVRVALSPLELGTLPKG